MTTDHPPREKAFRACTNCGNLTPAERPDCLYCGNMTVEAMAAHQEAEREHRFLAALFTRSNPLALMIIGINAGVFLLEWLAGGMGGLSADLQVIRAFGAKNNELINQQHEYWRLVTAIFIHIGFLHFLLNNYALWIIGQEIERLYGSARFVVLYLVTGIASTVASYIFNPGADSAGASGAIFGLFGVMATFAFRFRKELPERLSSDIRRRILPVIAINLIFGFSVQIVDNAAHIGGLLTGIALALIIPYKRPDERGTARIWRILQVVCLAIMLLSFVAAFRNYEGPKLSAANLTTSPSNKVESLFDGMRNAINQLEEAVNSFVEILQAHNGSADLKAIQDKLMRAAAEASAVPAPVPQAARFKQQLIQLINDEQAIVRTFADAGPKNWLEVNSRQAAFNSRYEAFRQEFDPWLRSYLEQHGYKLRDD